MSISNVNSDDAQEEEWYSPAWALNRSKDARRYWRFRRLYNELKYAWNVVSDIYIARDPPFF